MRENMMASMPITTAKLGWKLLMESWEFGMFASVLSEGF